MTYINDKTYWTISDEVYRRDITSESYNHRDLPDWKIVEPEGAMLHDTNGSGFDATVFYNEKDNQVIIGYRGTEPPDRPFWSVLMDWGTDLNDVIGHRPKNLEKVHEYYEKNKAEIDALPLDLRLSFIRSESEYQNNQFVQAQNLYDVVRKEYPNAEISTTGHSLGGAEAEYVAVRNGLNSVSFNAPSIVHILPDDLLQKVKNGDFLKTNVAYVNPGDTIGSGATDAERHVGETYYINSTFDDANKRSVFVPFSIPQKRDNPFAQFVLGHKWTPIQWVPITLPFGRQDALTKFYNSIAGKQTHSLKHFEFDETTGNIKNNLFTMDGETVNGYPRVEAYERMMAARAELQEALGNLVERYGSQWGAFGQLAAAGLGVTIGDGHKVDRPYAGGSAAGNKGGGTIQLTPAELQQAARQMRSSLQEFSNDTRTSIRLFQAQVETSHSQSLTPIVYNAMTSFERMNQWYQQSITDIANYIDLKAQLFIAADQ
ncbi:hypothetical protein [Paenibacillus bouchesdurhonensis]|uniref:hypothetical protein n=1 Tax=Paenibacillus bouchesdurhonensis TaxID=1870990 RepID=UPI000DA620F7|nr:hypothetical protein [Paenibacillus bouchesdurhonensis]